MADSHSTPDTDQSGTERSLIVGYRPSVFDKSTPKIILSGKWLRAAGFDTGQQVTIKVMKDASFWWRITSRSRGCRMIINGRKQSLLR
jgi:hypothetical protein